MSHTEDRIVKTMQITHRHYREAENIRNLLAQFIAFSSSCKSIKEITAAQETVCSAIEEFLQNCQSYRGNFNLFRKDLKIAHQLFNSLSSSIEEGEINRSEFLAEMKNFESSVYPEIDLVFSSFVSGLPNQVQQSAGPISYDNKVTAAILTQREKDNREIERKQEERNEKREAEEAMQDFAGRIKFNDYKTLDRSRVPTAIKSDFSLLKLPVFPIFDDFSMVLPENLKKAGIKFTKVSGYILFEDQFILMINKEAAFEYVQEMSPNKGKAKLLRNHNECCILYARYILQLVEERSTEELIMMEGKLPSHTLVNHPTNARYLMAWLLPKAKLMLLSRRNFKVLKWGFPWDADFEQISPGSHT